MCVTSSMFITALAPNAVALSIVKGTTGLEIHWFQWLVGFLPIGLVLLILTPLLVYLIYPPEIKTSKEVTVWAADELKKMGKVTRREWTMVGLVILAIVLWITGYNPSIRVPYLGSRFIHPTTVVLLGIALMLLTRIVTWDDIISNRGAWNVLLWFATLVTLAGGLNAVGFIKWFGELAAVPLKGLDPILALALLVVLFFMIHYFFASLSHIQWLSFLSSSPWESKSPICLWGRWRCSWSIRWD